MKMSSTMCGKFLNSICQQDDDCGPENSICVDNHCKCEPNFSREGDSQCNSPQLKMPCSTYTDCNSLIKHSLCSENNKCECFPTYFPINETACVPYHESYCSDSDPCKLENSVCINNLCRCASHYSYIGLKCEPKLKTTCNIDDECKIVYFQKCSIDMKNTFNSSYTFMHHFECKLQIGDKCTLDEQCSPVHSRCIDNLCQCKPKFVPSGTGNKCVSVYSNRKCTTHEDCAHILNGMCSDDNECICEINHEQMDENTCLPLLDQYCDKQSKCVTDNAICSYNTCTCDTLFMQQSIYRCLSTYLNQPCKLQDDCKQIKYAECSKDNKCVCRSNYIELNAVTCAPFLGGYCESNEECFVNQTKCIDNKCTHAPNLRLRTMKLHLAASRTRKCQDDGDCLFVKNGICSSNGECGCKPNHILVNQTLCLPLLNEDCSDSSCIVDNSYCIEDQCECADHFVQHSNDKCLPTWLNEPCKTDADCREIKNAVCSKKKTCVCKKSFNQFSLTRCTSLSDEFCTTNKDCPVKNSACIKNFCKCNPGFDQLDDNQCIPRISIKSCSSDHDCSDISNSFCSNKRCTCKKNYVAINITMCLIRSSVSCYDDTGCSEINGFCFQGQCLCRLNHDMMFGECVPKSLGGSCRWRLDCSSIPNAVCSNDKKCICGTNYYALSRSYCAPKIGTECSNVSPCEFDNSECFQSSTCQCQQSFYAASETQCLSKTAVSSCSNDLECGEPWHGECSNEKKCSCKENNVAINISTCYPILKGLCWRDDQCVIQNSVCVDYHCDCKVGYISVANNLCIRMSP
ncbi:uncharacterized protein LOC141528395 [Cotesia typhae]|uniref:uncharacterized protein LOC141528395 n=1 Tax=Cotesia typhae TaxID=2053667 RepID=UPI003D6886C3